MRPMIDWIVDAVCRNIRDPDIFFPSVGARAKKLTQHTRYICAKCPVQQDCLDYAVAHDEEGFWGGKTKDERKALPSFVQIYIKSEYERLGLLEPRPNIDELIAKARKEQQEALSQEDLFSWQYTVDPPF